MIIVIFILSIAESLNDDHVWSRWLHWLHCKKKKDTNFEIIMVQTSECVLDPQTENLDFIDNKVCPLKVSNFSNHCELFARYQNQQWVTDQVRIYSYTLDTKECRSTRQDEVSFSSAYALQKVLIIWEGEIVRALEKVLESQIRGNLLNVNL